jgi:hypothetical protein
VETQTGPKAVEFEGGLAETKSMQFDPRPFKLELWKNRAQLQSGRSKFSSIFASLAALSSLCFQIENAHAQMDPSSALLLSPPAQVAPRPTPNERRGESGRYQVRPTPSAGNRRPDPVSAINPSPTPLENVDGVANVKPSTAPAVSPNASGDSPHEKTPPGAPGSAENSAAVERMVTASKVLEMSFSPGYFYLDSKSDSAYRNFQAASPAVQLDAAVWLSDHLAVELEMGTSLAASVSDGLNRQVALNRNDLAIGIQRRRVDRGGEFLYGLGFFESQLRVSADAQRRPRLRTSGVKLNLEGLFRLPAGFWGLGVDFAPKVSHAEEATGIQLKSGGNVDSHALAFSLRRVWTLDETSSVFLKLTHSVERHLFSGDSSLADPVTGSTLTNVGVTQSTTLIQFGIGWSN